MKKSYYLIGIILLILVVGSLFLLNLSVAPSVSEKIADGNSNFVETGIVTIFIDFDDGRLEEFSQEISGESTAYDVLKATGLEIATKDFIFGILVASIDDTRGGTDGKYWIYYVNGIPAKVSADNQVVNPGDEIIWRFEEENIELGL